jgi:hypothetical protein
VKEEGEQSELEQDQASNTIWQHWTDNQSGAFCDFVVH